MILLSQIQHLLIRLRPGRIDHTGNIAAHKPLIILHLRIGIQTFQITVLHISNNLHSLAGKMFKISRQLKRRPVNLRTVNLNPIRLHLRNQILKPQLVDHLIQCHCFHIVLLSSPFSFRLFYYTIFFGAYQHRKAKQSP